MRKGLLTFFYTIAMVWSAVAQDQTDQSKYELLRETINFLATDKTVSKDTSFRVSCETLDYDCFKQQLSGNPITGIERWYNAWRSMEATDEAGLTTLRNQVFNDIFERPGKGYRKQLAGYEDYVARTAELIQQPADEKPTAQIPEDAAETPPEHPVQSSVVYPEQVNDKNENPEKEDTMIAYFALVLAIIALVLIARPLFQKKERQQIREQEPTVDFYGFQERLEELAVRTRQLEQKLPDGRLKDEALIHLTEIMESVEKRVAELESQTNVG